MRADPNDPMRPPWTWWAVRMPPILFTALLAASLLALATGLGAFYIADWLPVTG